MSARARVSLVSWEGGSHAVFFMVPLGLPGARSMTQALRLPFQYLVLLLLQAAHGTVHLMSIDHTYNLIIL